jgi:transcriptional regulator with XRE-family HTH domain
MTLKVLSMVVNPKPVDKIVGSNIRAQRLNNGMSQETLAKRIGLTFQQVQKYEKGTNRVGGSRMVQIAEALDVPVNILFEGTQSAARVSRDSVQTLIANPYALRLLKAFSKITRATTRQIVVKLAEDLAAESDKKD